jgi:gamma-D-glutamyl-L-lysine dipeptidyl-peptidase
MKYGIANLSIVPVRKEKSECSEMVTQVLFGEHFEISEEEENWFQICLANDKYQGWIDKKLCEIISESTYFQIENKPQVVTTEMVNNIFISTGQIPLRIIIGSTLPFFDKKSNLFNIEDEKYRFDGIIKKFYKKDNRENIVNLAMNFLNTPYMWGGKTPFGIDCSGLVQVIYKVIGVAIPRDADLQADQGNLVNSVDIAQNGDVAFFENEEGKIIHVGIIIENNKIIHCSGKVRIDKLDFKGIFNKELNKYTHKLKFIKNLLN